MLTGINHFHQLIMDCTAAHLVTRKLSEHMHQVCASSIPGEHEVQKCTNCKNVGQQQSTKQNEQSRTNKVDDHGERTRGTNKVYKQSITVGVVTRARARRTDFRRKKSISRSRKSFELGPSPSCVKMKTNAKNDGFRVKCDLGEG